MRVRNLALDFYGVMGETQHVVFGKTRKAIETLQVVVERLVDKLDKLDQHGPSPDAATAFATLLGKQIDNQGSLVTAFGEIAVKASARRAGIRGGTKRAATAERDATGRFRGTKRLSESRCPLCENPMHRPVSIAMIQAHRAHESEGYRNGNSHRMEPVEPEPAENPPDSNQGG